jgi:argininosuccinate synthase
VLEVKKLTRANRFLSFAIAKKGRESNFISIKEIVGINGKMDVPTKILSSLKNWQMLTPLVEIHGDTIIGIKGRVGFEAAAPLIIKASFTEKHTLGKWQQYWKEQLGTGTECYSTKGNFLIP